jgi:hypothetical protein
VFTAVVPGFKRWLMFLRSSPIATFMNYRGEMILRYFSGFPLDQ